MPDAIIRPGHGAGVAVISVLVSPTDRNILASRGDDGSIMLWDIMRRTALKVFRDVPNIYPTANVEFRLVY